MFLENTHGSIMLIRCTRSYLSWSAGLLSDWGERLKVVPPPWLTRVAHMHSTYPNLPTHIRRFIFLTVALSEVESLPECADHLVYRTVPTKMVCMTCSMIRNPGGILVAEMC
jgi:hypothetical protein